MDVVLMNCMDRRTALQGIAGMLGTLFLPSEAEAKFKTCGPRSGYRLITDGRTTANPHHVLERPAFPIHQKDINPRSLSYGRYVGPQDYTGKVVALNLWSRECTPCLNEFPELEKVYKSHADLMVLGLEADVLIGDEAAVNTALSKVTFPILGLEGKIPASVRICQDLNT